ncbi:MAG: purine-nucleoside phosphorylase [Beijerinckiaceae bacterium]
MSEDKLIAAFEAVQARGFTGSTDIGIVLGTGLASAVEGIEEIVSIPYAELPGFPETSVSGHQGRFVIGKLEGVTVVCMMGRAHYYETGDSRAMALPIELMAMLGVKHLILTNTAGSVNADIVPGSIALITDHINFSGLNPLIGQKGDGGFISMVDAYDPRINRRFKLISATAGVTVREGVYMWFSGPSFESPAEVKMARTLGADFMGMSTVPETIIARTLALHVTGISAIANFAAGFKNADPTHIETREVARQAAISIRRLLRAYLAAREKGAS